MLSYNGLILNATKLPGRLYLFIYLIFLKKLQKKKNRKNGTWFINYTVTDLSRIEAI